MIKHTNWFNTFNLYILLWSLYFVQGLLIENNLTSRMLYIPFLLLTMYYVTKVYSSYKQLNITMKVLCWFFALLVCYGVALLILNDAVGSDRKSFLMMLFESLGPVFVFYVLSIQGKITEDILKNCFWLLLAVSILSFFVYKQEMLELANSTVIGFEENTNRAAYDFVGLISFVFLFNRKPLLQYMLLLFLCYFVVLSIKRGAFVSGALVILWFIYVSVESSSKQKRAGIILLVVTALIVGFYFINQFYNNSDYFQYRIELTKEGSSSGRDMIYGALWQHYINNNNIVQLLFGEGAYHTQNIVFYKAHNDWLEILIDCGIVAVLIYLVYWICFMMDCRNSRPNTLVHSMLVACLMITLSRSFYSMSFSDMLMSTNLIMGYCFANISRQPLNMR